MSGIVPTLHNTPLDAEGILIDWTCLFLPVLLPSTGSIEENIICVPEYWDISGSVYICIFAA